MTLGRAGAVTTSPCPVGPDFRVRPHPAFLIACLLVAAAVLWLSHFVPAPAAPSLNLAYIGPGAGFAFVGSFLSLLLALLLGALSILIWPLRVLWRAISGKQGYKHARVKKIIFLGLDGFDPDLCERFFAEGKLPNLAKLKEQGTYRRLRTTYPPLSPVAWSTFATGVNPAKHSLYDFLNRSMKTYVPELSSSRVNSPTRIWKLGSWRIPLSRASVEMGRKSRTFWSILGEHQIGCSILRVPITFPPEKFNGKLLSAMCTPDLLGTQGSFQQFTTKLEQIETEGGTRLPLERKGNQLHGAIEGPENSLREGAGPMKVPFTIDLNGADAATIRLNGEAHKLKIGEYSPWISLNFNAGLGVKVQGICRLLITSTAPEFSLYVTPINIDPEKPALPISHPSYFATYLAKLLGAYATLGLAEDTWALNERVIDEQAFLDQAYSICRERESMWKNTLEKTKRGVAACVFDTSDRVQHMFYRYLEPDHPAHRTNASGRTASRSYEGVIEDLYQRMDAIVGSTLKHVDDKTIFFVLSDHGFKSFQRGINLNAWLLQNGYLHMKEGAAPDTPYLRAVDWSRTRAYTFGLAGLYINLKGRDGQGIVSPGAEADALKKELAEKLTGFRDGEKNQLAIREAYTKEAVYRGPYIDVAPDIVVGYNSGYRSSWGAAVGKVGSAVFEDNVKAWSGDHCMDPCLVPGVVFCNRKFDAADPGIEDLAPTTLSLFGVKTPAYMEGKDLFANGAAKERPAA